MEPAPYRPRCVYLTCKSMQVWGEDFESDPEFQAGMVEFLCTETMTRYGPDGCEAALEPCRDPQRTCFREYVGQEPKPAPQAP
jgi:hypothetical protein